MNGRTAAWLLALILLARLATIGIPPLFDKTEGRYGEIAREMAESGDWVTPTLHGGDPFWGKPPLHFWATAISIRIFGVNEWASRLPSFLVGIGILAITYAASLILLRRRGTAWIAVILLASSLLYYLLAGQVLLDGTFTLAVTGALAACAAPAMGRRGRPAGYLFFFCLALALLAKGPIGLVLVGAVLVLHAIASRSAGTLRALPWLGGIPFMIAVAAPWYLLAERKTPGFLRYFFVNEHILRYTRSDYGDLYGHGHVAPYGMIWLFTAAALLPWTPIVIARGWRAFRRRREEPMDDAERYLWAWALAAPLFFTLSRSLSFPYIFPSLPPFALLVARQVQAGRCGPALTAGSALLTLVLLLGGAIYGTIDFDPPVQQAFYLIVPLLVLILWALVGWRRGRERSLLTGAALVIPVAVTCLTLFWHDEIGLRKSTRHLADAVSGQGEGKELLFFDGLPLSAEFYFRGSAIDLEGNAQSLLAQAADEGEEILFVRKSREKYLPEFGAVSPRLLRESGKYSIYNVPPGAGPAGE